MTIRRSSAVIAAAILLGGFTGTVAGSESEEEETSGGGAHEYHHELALFLGVTDEEGHSSEGTIGVEYAYALYPRWAIGGLIEYAGGDLRNMVLGVPAYFRPGRGWVLVAAPGVELHEGRGVVSGEHDEVDEDESSFLFRVGVMYKFRVGERFGILPALDVDFVDGRTDLVYGVNFAWEFGK